MTILVTDIEKQIEVTPTPTPTQETEPLAVAMATDTTIPPPSPSADNVATTETAPVTETETSTDVVATPDATMVPMEDHPRQGALCCGCCCDFRRAVIVINALSIVFGVISTLVAFGSSASIHNETYDADDVLQLDNDRDSAIQYGIAAGIILAISVVFNIVGLVGAIKYNIYMVGANMVWLIVSFVVAVLIERKWLEDSSLSEDGEGFLGIGPGAIERVLYVYAHAGFVSQVRAGILTKETYPRERHSSC